MSVYQLVPGPDLATKEQNYAFWNDAFSEDEISRIRQIGDQYMPVEAGLDGNRIDEVQRKSRVSWLGLNQDTAFIYDRLAWVARMLNAEFFEFDLYGFSEDLQYTIYQSQDAHYDWHIDKGNLQSAPRKLSLVLQLSDPTEYEGGDLEFMMNPSIIKAEKKKGIIYGFPSWLLHRVTPVTAGTRKSLVVWLCGPKFR